MYVVVWEYEVKPDAVDRFLSGYGPEGQWATLFARGEGFLGVELYRSTAEPNRFVTFDRWRSREACVEFMTRFAEEYAALDRKFDALTVREMRLGEVA